MSKTFCFKCGTEILEIKPGFRDVCLTCSSDIHACMNCLFYSATSYNECSEPNADRVLNKEKANFCEYYQLAGKGSVTKGNNDALKKLNDLFK